MFSIQENQLISFGNPNFKFIVCINLNNNLLFGY